MNKKTVAIYISESLDEQIKKRGDNRSMVFERDLARLYEIYRRALNDVDISYEEACLIVDALNGTIMDITSASFLWMQIEDACRYEGLDQKWKIEGKALVDKLKKLSYSENLALIDAAERFWALPDNERNMETVKEIFFIKRWKEK